MKYLEYAGVFAMLIAVLYVSYQAGKYLDERNEDFK